MVPWFLSTGFLGGLGLALSAFVALVVWAVQVAQGAEAFDPSRLVTLVMGTVQAVAGVLLIVWRVRKGNDPSSPEPRIGGSVPGGSVGLALLASGGLLSLLLCGCGPVLSPDQGNATRRVTSLSCAIVRELVRPGVLPVSAESAALADRVCNGVELAAGFVVPLLTQPRSGALPLLSAAPARAPEVPCAEWGARCAAPGLSAAARDACAEVVAGCQAGEAVEVRGGE